MLRFLCCLLTPFLFLPCMAHAATGGPDSFGYTWADSSSSEGPSFNYLFAPGSDLELDDDDTAVVDIGFDFEFYGTLYSQVRVQSNGAITFGDSSSQLPYYNSCPMESSSPVAAPFWDDLDPSNSSSGGVYAGTTGVAPNRIFIAEWWLVMNFGDTGDVSVQVQLHEADNHLEFHYQDVDLDSGDQDQGASATIGIGDGVTFSDYSCNTAQVADSMAIGYFPPIDGAATGSGGDTAGDVTDDDSDTGSGGTTDDTPAPPPAPLDCIDTDLDGQCQDTDCDDWDPLVYPGATEVCDGFDNNCDGQVDEGYDLDNDGWATCDGDCDDQDWTLRPDAAEICDGIDNNCDGSSDEGFDADGDGWSTCEGDCDDSSWAVHPNASESCNGADDNCDGSVDEGADADNDGWSSCDGDCDDTNELVSPTTPEECNGLDDNCDGAIDESEDNDGDGWSVCDGDCNDNLAGIHPGASEVCDGLDTDCDGINNDASDADGDGFSSCDGDCNDDSIEVFPGAVEVPDDGIDQDCDGSDEQAGSAPDETEEDNPEETSDNPDQHEEFDDYFEAPDTEDDEAPVYTGAVLGCSCSVGRASIVSPHQLGGLALFMGLLPLRRRRSRSKAT
ncbi:MAG: hypothetical protein CL928_10210 [Deltaproteobacteria bacterium]|nr:hypothetical protein [Deltaproteobacteria bacterium]